LSYPSINFALSLHLLCPTRPPTLSYPPTYFVLFAHLLCPILPSTSILYNRYFAIFVYFSTSNFILRDVSKQEADSVADSVAGSVAAIAALTQNNTTERKANNALDFNKVG